MLREKILFKLKISHLYTERLKHEDVQFDNNYTTYKKLDVATI